MGDLPGRRVSDQQFTNLTLRGQLTELEDVALESDSPLAGELEKTTREARNHAVDESVVDQERLVEELTLFLNSLGKTSPGDAKIEDILGKVRAHIPE